VDVAETLLVYAGIPLGIVVVIVLLNLRGARRRARYRPGQPWDYPPVWYEPHPLRPAAEHGAGHGELEVGHSGHAAVERAGAGPVLGSGAGQSSGHPGGPLGGARGTW
jgi:hypothetical protein